MNFKPIPAIVKNIALFFLLLNFAVTTQAQQYPVQGFLSIIPPYPAQLADYANPNINRLNLTLTLNDISVNNKRVRLKVFVLRQNSLFTQTSGNYFGDMPVILTSGIPEQLTSNELAGYFKLQNLQGIVPDSYAQPLGEGFMNIYFVVYDYFTGRQLSNKIEFPFFILLNDPPLLNLPLNGAHISNAGAIAPQIAFSWTSRATQASNTDYVFTLAPIYDPSGDPFTQFLASIPLYQTTISNQTNLLYGFAEPPLLPGKTYGWRVQAKAKSGFEDVGLYKQNGFSEIHTFTYDNPCLPIADQDVTVEARASDRLYVQWQPPTDAGQQLAGGYMVAYRKYSAGGMWNWQEQTTQTPNYYITGLEPTTDYEVKVARTCTDGTYTYTNPQKATTLAVNQLPVKIDCGKIPNIDISNQNPLPQLNSGDVVMAGDFPVTILRANNVAGLFSGEGWVKVPYLADTKIHVTYQNIKVNTDYKLIDGYFETTYKANGGNIASIDTTLANFGVLYNQVKNLLGNVVSWITDITKTAQNIALINKYVDSIKTENPSIPDSLISNVKDDLDSLKKIGSTIKPTDTTAIKQATELANNTNADLQEVNSAAANSAAPIRYPFDQVVYRAIDLLNNNIMILADKPLPNTIVDKFVEKTNNRQDRPTSGESTLKNVQDKDIIYNPFLILDYIRLYQKSVTDPFIFPKVDSTDSYRTQMNGLTTNPTLKGDQKLDTTLLQIGVNTLAAAYQKHGQNQIKELGKLNISYKAYTAADYRVIVTRGNKIYEKKNEDILGDVNEGETPINEGEALSFKFIEVDKRDPNIRRNIATAKWIRNLDTLNAIIGTTFTINAKIADVIDIVYKDTANKRDISFTLTLNVKSVNSLSKSKIDTIDVSNVDTSIRDIRRQLFKDVMLNIKAKSPELYSFVHTLATQIKLVYATYPDMATHIRAIGGDTDPNKVLYGFADAASFTTTNQFELINMVKDGNIIKDATIIGKLSSSDRQNTALATPNKKMNDATNLLYTAISYYRQTMADSLKQMILSGNLDTAFIGKVRFGIGVANINNFITFSVLDGKQMQLLLNETAIAGSRSTFTQKMAHEIAHLYYAYQNQLIKLKWFWIRELKSRYNYDLGDGLDSNGACSTGPSHERYNPENPFVCGIESKY